MDALQHTKSSDPSKAPEFNPRYFEEDVGVSSCPPTRCMHRADCMLADEQILLEQFKFVRKLADVEPFKARRMVHPEPFADDLPRVCWCSNTTRVKRSPPTKILRVRFPLVSRNLSSSSAHRMDEADLADSAFAGKRETG
jgi:hypothetical protein